MLKLLLVLCTAAYVSTEDNCSMEDRNVLLSMWESVWSAEFAGRRVLIAQEVFKKLFEKDESTRALFKNVNVDDINSAKFRAHCIRVSNGLDTIINLAVDSNALAEQLLHLGQQHAKFPGLKAGYFKLFREAFAEVLPQAVPCFNSGVWFRCIKMAQDKIAAALPA